ncbi:hypothetical protein EVAR_24174_1 [Eumeta japonica]|uniref:Uncharacterized protein n=1 Tax=Eumeta variegata TaxID=151549 RepID=A0A4C1W4J8_EUMVA|nr:hypothetical protein EVAR_24174_1 [Eumeta japonica]
MAEFCDYPAVFLMTSMSTPDLLGADVDACPVLIEEHQTQYSEFGVPRLTFAWLKEALQPGPTMKAYTVRNPTRTWPRDKSHECVASTVRPRPAARAGPAPHSFKILFIVRQKGEGESDPAPRAPPPAARPCHSYRSSITPVEVNQLVIDRVKLTVSNERSVSGADGGAGRKGRGVVVELA